MRDHSTIIRERGIAAVARAVTTATAPVSTAAVQRWADRNSIPGEYWEGIARAGVTTLDELARAAAAKRRAADPAPGQAVAA